MRNSISRTIVAGVAALAMAAAVILPTTPASAGGFRMGGGGWQAAVGAAAGTAAAGAAGVGGGARLARRLGRRPGLARRATGVTAIWYNGWWGPAIAAGVLAGAALATYPAWGYGGYGYGYGGGGGCWQYRPTYDGYGNPLGQSWVNLC